MSKPREKWWGYVKACIREYPSTYKALETARMEATVPGKNPSRPTEWEALLHMTDFLPGDSDILQGQRGKEFYGVRAALIETAGLKDGPERLQIIGAVFFKGTHTLTGAAALCHVSGRTARRWHGDFIRLTASHMGLTD